MYRLFFGVPVLFAVAACSGSPSAPTPTTPPTATCSFSISSTTLNVAGTGATATLAVTTGSTCAWTVTSSAGFVTVTSATSATGPGTVSLAVAPNTGEARSATVTIGGQALVVNQAAGDALFGTWAGTIAKGAGCPAAVPASVTWGGIIQRNALGNPELVITATSLGVVNQTLVLTLNGNNLQFSVPIAAVFYTFNATIAADRRSLTGTFSGGGCSGTWAGTRQ